MMQLPALSAEERACLQSGLAGNALTALAERLRRHLMVSLGGAVAVGEWPGAFAQDLAGGDEPVIRIDPGLAAAWLAMRLGGKPGSAGMPIKDDAPIEPFRRLIRRALAETVINLGAAAWPQAMRLSVAIGPQAGSVEIFWNSARAVSWARRAIREKA